MIDIFRRGVNALGHCNHVGGILFAIEDFCRGDLKNMKSQFLVPQDSVAGMLPGMCKWTLNQ